MEQEQAGRGFRYKMEHIGDIFVDAIGNLVGGVKTSFMGISLTYEIHSLHTKKKKIVGDIGERVVEIRKSDPGINVVTDDAAISLFAKYDEMEKRLEESIMKREARINRWRLADECAE